MKPQTYFFELAEEQYAAESGRVFDEAEKAGQQQGRHPEYPEPFNTVGCGYGSLVAFVEKQCNLVTAEMNLDSDTCRQSELMMILYCGTKLQYEDWKRRVLLRLQPVEKWVVRVY